MRSLLKFSAILFLSALTLGSCRNEDNKIEPTCFDETKNQGELRADCGGPNCPECPPSCDDGIANQGELSPVNNSQVLGIDCGGENCEPCSTCGDEIQNAHWVRDPNLTEDDLLSNPDSVKQSMTGVLYRLVMETGIDCGFPCPLTCTDTSVLCEDGIQNGTEEGIDCGGSCDNPCPPPTCSDGVQNGTETGIDCGDGVGFLGVCGPCPDPTCDDGIQNVHIELNEEYPTGYIAVIETGIDCDNSPLTSCPDCPIPTCFDGILNGSEQGIDCGGACGTACDPLDNCNNGIMDGNEAGIDCDFDESTPCPTCPTCDDMIKNGPEFDVDCLDYPIPGFDMCAICPSCHDGIQTEENFELDIDCGGPDCEPCQFYLTAEQIGSANAGFRDQYSYNQILAEAGMEDTLELDHNTYPGFKIEYQAALGSGIAHMRIIANQGFMTQNDGLFVKTVRLYLPFPDVEAESVDPFIPFTEDMLNTAAPSIGQCIPIGINVTAVPFLVYEERLVDGGFSRCSRSYILNAEPSMLSFDYLFGAPEASNYYTTGRINLGSLRSVPDIISGDATLGEFSNVEFGFQYSYFHP